MAHPALERAFTLPAVLDRQEFEIINCADVQDRGETAFLLVFIRHTLGYGLDSNTISLAYLQMVGWHFVVIAHRDREPRAVRTLLVSHQYEPTSFCS